MEHTNNGKIALIFGILSMFLLIVVFLLPIILAILAIIFGVLARKNGDKYGTYGMILGILTIILTIVFSAIIYFQGGSLF